MKKAARYGMVVVLLNCFCTSHLITYKDHSYDKKPGKPPRLYVFPVSDITLNEGADAFARQTFDNNLVRYKYAVLRSINAAYLPLAREGVRKNFAKVVDSVPGAAYATTNRAGYIYWKVEGKQKDSVLTVLVPDKKSLDSMGVDCEYAFFITDLSFAQTTYKHRYVIPTPIFIVSGYTTGPAFLMQGKYVLWDYTKGCPVSAGNFRNKLDGCLNGKNGDAKKLKIAFQPILNRSPFWRFDVDSDSTTYD